MALEAYDPYDPNLDGRVYTWGDNDFVLNNGSGVLGIGAADDSNTPVCVHRGEQDYNDPNQIYLKHIVAISAGWDHSMALEEDDPWDPNLDGRVYTWGNNGQGWAGWFGERSEGGRLGDGSTDSNDTPVLVLRGG
jgi:alpha-tubulin suppressor-like RCC1 family protein